VKEGGFGHPWNRLLIPNAFGDMSNALGTEFLADGVHRLLIAPISFAPAQLPTDKEQLRPSDVRVRLSEELPAVGETLVMSGR